ncbi:hypothetical protein JK358_15005 [Nocardia sp. 2]|uniref:RNA polymerase sigma factor 70 region 4 type 2 domain-containing protein n=1 Tax=Nocardia acididurans TaxID=2802282 RepID=A0ABS1M4Y3_9NOCA|nr:sigma factor-like helix-turn-helix DNA-binding protein [Nocardia acididurans]MBL1075702.1 hypothetical protein [Nocardia acididurans]
MREEFVPAADGGDVLRTTAFEALLGEVLRACARDPRLLLGSTDSDATPGLAAPDRESGRAAPDRESGLAAPDREERLALLAARAGLPAGDPIALRRLVIAALGQLPRREREALVLCTYEGNTYAETAELMGSAAGTVMTYVRSALRRIRNTVATA